MPEKIVQPKKLRQNELDVSQEKMPSVNNNNFFHSLNTDIRFAT